MRRDSAAARTRCHGMEHLRTVEARQARDSLQARYTRLHRAVANSLRPWRPQVPSDRPAALSTPALVMAGGPSRRNISELPAAAFTVNCIAATPDRRRSGSESATKFRWDDRSHRLRRIPNLQTGAWNPVGHMEDRHPMTAANQFASESGKRVQVPGNGRRNDSEMCHQEPK